MTVVLYEKEKKKKEVNIDVEPIEKFKEEIVEPKSKKAKVKIIEEEGEYGR